MDYIKDRTMLQENKIFKSLKTFGERFVKDFKKFRIKTVQNWQSSFEHHDLKEDIVKFVKELEKAVKSYNIKKIKKLGNIEVPENVDKQRGINILDRKLEEIRLELTPGEISLLGLDTLFRKLRRKFEIEDYNFDRTFNKYLETIDYRIKKLAQYRVKYDGKIQDEISNISKKEYEEEKIDLQEELLKLQEWVISENKRVAIVFEGRDAAGKGSSIKRFIEYLMPKASRVVALGVPNDWEREHWFDRYEKHLPTPGEIVFFDRSWYNRGVVEPVNDYCSKDQYKYFMKNVVPWEESLIDNGLILIKFWFSVTKETQLLRFELRKESGVKYWKYSDNDMKQLDKWEETTKFKNRMLDKTSTEKSPWVVIDSNDKKVARLNSLRYVLQQIDYPEKNLNKEPYSEVIHVIK